MDMLFVRDSDVLVNPRLPLLHAGVNHNSVGPTTVKNIAGYHHADKSRTVEPCTVDVCCDNAIPFIIEVLFRSVSTWAVR